MWDDLKRFIGGLTTVLIWAVFIGIIVGGLLTDALPTILGVLIFVALSIITRGKLFAVIIVCLILYFIVGLIYQAITGAPLVL